MLVNKIKRVNYEQLKPGDIIVYGEGIFKNKATLDCIVLAVDYKNRWFLAITSYQRVKKYPFCDACYVLSNQKGKHQ